MDLFAEQLTEILHGTGFPQKHVDRCPRTLSEPGFQILPALLEDITTELELDTESISSKTYAKDEMNILKEESFLFGSESTSSVLQKISMFSAGDSSRGSTASLDGMDSSFELEDVSPRAMTPPAGDETPEALSPQPVRTAELSPIPERKQFKRWKNATPSKFCHFCGRLPKAERIACKNINYGTCRKVFCRPCIEKIFGQWDDWEVRLVNWECTHCSGACPTKASCRYYSKTNSRRFLKGKTVSLPTSQS
ncbi:hypothetical protein NDN08_005170 [Rhodosorus marinus]|uniref:Zinc-finger domain-containing protein n=1 Tax=Rhodosorus marinus TaxID=101924 RepID=A0AAV8V3D4_9RHOD|nr:hypothetical protein NDN08_005170 [Rhodosorus marinus]